MGFIINTYVNDTRCTDPQVYITVVSDVDSLEFRTRTLIQGATLLYIDRGRGLRLSLEAPIGHTQDMVERFP